ncbi:hypothetical protein Kpol_1040p15 [Vanderwaltozyma polyspora DSM 70294]|uniref:Protein ATS1 n=1 Tax=Vanderwaltozyma polyspora (strain ATCC 22028 / DSM 70294 / BCRC 21397 / CBS 2163 / NBRC 10782 / NRRL Y-8283 / UCD 57-17) TaxID=436907 RepID=A7TPL0_VANPO|nr:uncharacterized protein Kpol_1040p15 [Vanderwaltozyma polyspora DSM 70294]EDO15802.1 hypothetical protein Kpol_1040p15 [Vanderwaltozyma polyspora DSM 70294]
MVWVNLGLDHFEDINEPELSLDCHESKVTKVSCGGNHSVVLLDDGSVLGCGDNSKGQLGFGGDSLVKSWQKVFDKNGMIVKDIVCGWEFTVIIDSFNGVYSCGEGLKGELGLGPDIRSSQQLSLVYQIPQGYQGKLFGSLNNCVLMLYNDEECKVYGWGANTKEQLLEPKSRKVSSPRLLLEFDNTNAQAQDSTVAEVSMGKDFIVVVDSKREIIDMRGKLPSGFVKERWLGERVECIGSMWTSIHLIQNGRMISFGNDKYKQLSRSGSTELKRFSTGSEHGVGMLEDGKVISWGWGEHGNCGELNGGNTSEFSKLYEPRGETDLYGGYATTWIVEHENEETVG